MGNFPSASHGHEAGNKYWGRRNDVDRSIWSQAKSKETVASVARLEALANIDNKNKEEHANKTELSQDEDTSMTNGCRLAYSSVLAVNNREEAQSLLAHIFTVALTCNPPKEIGGMLFYDEQTNAIVQVLEGPSFAVRDLFYQNIISDSRHTTVKVMWDINVVARNFAGFGMKLGSNPNEVLCDGLLAKDQQQLLRLEYKSRLAASTYTAAMNDIQAILGCAIVTNPKLHIGGVLFLNPRTLHVLQVLEGPQGAVHALYEKICKDNRHNECEVSSEKIVQEREFDQWGMLQGDTNLADWSSVLKGWTNPKRRRGRENVLENEGDGPGQSQ